MYCIAVQIYSWKRSVSPEKNLKHFFSTIRQSEHGKISQKRWKIFVIFVNFGNSQKIILMVL